MEHKKIIVIEGSPRRHGSSDAVSDQFIKGAQEAGHSVQKIYLNTKHIHACQGCRMCRQRDGECVFKDDAGTVIQQLIDADIFVFCSPIYFYSISAQLKLLIDRTFAREAEIKNKTAYFIASCAAPYEAPYQEFLDNAVNTFRGYLRCLENVAEGGILLADQTAMIENIEDNPAYKKAYAMGLTV